MAALPAVITENMEEIQALCARHGVKRLAVFGSAVKGTFDPERSDLDFVVELAAADPLERGRHYLEFWDSLEALLGRRVDLITGSKIRNPYLRQSIDAAHLDLYAAA
ncbi:MAG TPA: nucleotidyltransferase domain-containing protein [Thermoanaerobaculia bacterium]|nr:nucleotidyltransferase domain-containing protein [Thermoanaerobaculia bacterium]